MSHSSTSGDKSEQSSQVFEKARFELLVKDQIAESHGLHTPPLDHLQQNPLTVDQPINHWAQHNYFDPQQEQDYSLVESTLWFTPPMTPDQNHQSWSELTPVRSLDDFSVESPPWSATKAGAEVGPTGSSSLSLKESEKLIEMSRKLLDDNKYPYEMMPFIIAILKNTGVDLETAAACLKEGELVLSEHFNLPNLHNWDPPTLEFGKVPLGDKRLTYHLLNDWGLSCDSIRIYLLSANCV